MIHANGARILANKNRGASNIEEAYLKIERAAKKGVYSIPIRFLTNEDIAILEKEGFVVKAEILKNYSYYVISWRQS